MAKRLVITVMLLFLGLAQAQSRFGLILFYKASCPHCQRFAPIVQAFARHNHLPVLAFTLDHQSLSSFPGSVSPTASELQHFFPMGNIAVPTLYLADQRTQTLFPLMQGEATYQQLNQRVNIVAHRLSRQNEKNHLDKNTHEWTYDAN